MTDDSEWGPWIDHDGKGCPCRGMLAELEYADGDVFIRVVGEKPFWSAPHYENVKRYSGPRYRTSWDWSAPGTFVPVIRYRIRKPRALLDLIERVRELDDAPEGPVRIPQHEPTGETA